MYQLGHLTDFLGHSNKDSLIHFYWLCVKVSISVYLICRGFAVVELNAAVRRWLTAVVFMLVSMTTGFPSINGCQPLQSYPSESQA